MITVEGIYIFIMFFFIDEFPPLFRAFSNSLVLDCNSLLLTVQFRVTLTPEVQSTFQSLFSVTMTVHVLHGSRRWIEVIWKCGPS